MNNDEKKLQEHSSDLVVMLKKNNPGYDSKLFGILIESMVYGVYRHYGNSLNAFKNGLNIDFEKESICFLDIIDILMEAEEYLIGKNSKLMYSNDGDEDPGKNLLQLTEYFSRNIHEI